MIHNTTKSVVSKILRCPACNGNHGWTEITGNATVTAHMLGITVPDKDGPLVVPGPYGYDFAEREQAQYNCTGCGELLAGVTDRFEFIAYVEQHGEYSDGGKQFVCPVCSGHVLRLNEMIDSVVTVTAIQPDGALTLGGDQAADPTITTGWQQFYCGDCGELIANYPKDALKYFQEATRD